MLDLVDRKAILDILESWMRTVKRSMYAEFVKLATLDTLCHVVEDIKAAKNINTEQVRVECNIYDQEHIYRDCTVQVLTNTLTGDVSVGWWRNDR